jgi:hypothetical protein
LVSAILAWIFEVEYQFQTIATITTVFSSGHRMYLMVVVVVVVVGRAEKVSAVTGGRRNCCNTRYQAN